MTRVLLFTGKGGVGKTTVAAATALRCADAGQRTLVLSTDPAHSLADAFDTPLDSDALALAPHLWGQQLDATQRFEEVWGEMQGYLAQVFDWAGLQGIEAEELSIIPGLDEVFALSDIVDNVTSGTWDVVVVDCAPTAETLRLLSLPDVLRWYMERVFPLSRTVTKLVRPLVSRVSAMPVAGDAVFASTVAFYERLGTVRELLTDADRASVRLVVNPERMVIAEARRTATYLSLYGYRVDAVIVNRLLSEEINDPWFKAWKETHAEHVAAIVDSFSPVPVLRATLASEELIGNEALETFGAELYGKLDPSAVLHRGEPMQVETVEGHQVLRLSLPFAEHDDLELARNGSELLVRVGPHRRSIVLPDSLARRSVAGAALVDGRLEVRFSQDRTR